MNKKKNNTILRLYEDQLDNFTDSRKSKVVSLLNKLEKVNSVADSY